MNAIRNDGPPCNDDGSRFTPRHEIPLVGLSIHKSASDFCPREM